ncbi:hypothetical protein FQZ97_1063000 [compost metagenome]
MIGWLWVSIMPGISTLPARSINCVSASARAFTSASLPTLRILPLATATAWASGWPGSAVNTLPLNNSRSAAAMASIEEKASTPANRLGINRCIAAASGFYWSGHETSGGQAAAEHRYRAKHFCQTGKTLWTSSAP